MNRFARIASGLAVAAAFVAGPVSAQMMEEDIVDVAVQNGNFTTLAAALEAAGLVETLKSDGPFTVFAPTDEAFAKLPAGTVEALLQDKERLTQILTYHVVSGEVTSSQVVNLSEAETVNGAPIQITTTPEGSVKINNATVTAADVRASNGVIHVIDTVILPPSEQ